MNYYSTVNKTEPVDFRQALFNGLAPDGGLYLPEKIPKNNTDLFTSDLTYPEFAYNILRPYVSLSIPNDYLNNISMDAFNFEIPIIKLTDRIRILELFHGPTLAFKDFAARFMARCIEYLLENEITILVATSGDTGSAVASGFFGIEGIRVVILYPSNRVSMMQEKQLTTMGNNITALEINGTFDDCQNMVKKAFIDKTLREKILLSSANSINIARLLPQSVYYAWASKKVMENHPVTFSVPCGNFGNITGGIFAKRMGFPISKFVAATNSNSIFTEFLHGGQIKSKKVVKTLSNAMDVSYPNNLERVKLLYDNNLNNIKKDIISWAYSDKETEDCIKEIKKSYNYLIDPHTAIGILGINSYQNKSNSKNIGIVLSTAHPAKFSNIIEPIIKEKIIIPNELKKIIKKRKTSVLLNNKYSELKEYLICNF